MIAVFSPVVGWALIIGWTLGVMCGWQAAFTVWWLVMHRAWVNGHELRRKRRMRALRHPRQDRRGRWS